MPTDLHWMSLSALAQLLVRGEVSSREIVAAYLDRIASLDHRLHAFIEDFDESVQAMIERGYAVEIRRDDLARRNLASDEQLRERAERHPVQIGWHRRERRLFKESIAAESFRPRSAPDFELLLELYRPRDIDASGSRRI